MDSVFDYLGGFMAETLRLENSQDAIGEAGFGAKPKGVKSANKNRSASPSSKGRTSRGSARRTGSPVKHRGSDASHAGRKKRGSPVRNSQSAGEPECPAEPPPPPPPPKDIVYRVSLDSQKKQKAFSLGYDYDSVNKPFTGVDWEDEQEVSPLCHHPEDEPLHRCMGHHKLPILWEDTHGDQVNLGGGYQKPLTPEKQDPEFNTKAASDHI